MAKIKDLPKVDRPREKLLKYGPGKLKNQELLALVIGSGTKGVNARSIAGRILKKHKNKLDSISVGDLIKEKGLGAARAAQVSAALELGKRLFSSKESALVLSPNDIWTRCEDFRSSKKEHFVVFLMDARSQIIRRDTVSIGTLTTSLVHPREVFEPAIKASAHSIVLAHNHPSGKVSPTREDIKITERLQKAGTLLDIPVGDHVIVSDKEYYSFKEHDLI